MPKLSTIYVAIKAGLKDLKKDFKKAHEETKKAAKGLQGTLNKITFGQAKLGALAFAGTATYAFSKVASASIDVASSFESMEIKLNQLTGGKGKETLDSLNKWALEMPVNTQEAVNAFVRMKAMGLDPTIEKMQTLVDVSSIFGEEALGTVSLALGQMSTLGKLSSEELNQLAGAGINAKAILKDTFGMTVEELQKSGKSINEIIDGIWKGLDTRYGGAAKAAMKSWQGLTATFKSYLVEISKQVMDAGAFEELKKWISEANEYLKNWLETNKDFIKNDLPKHIKEIAGNIKDVATALKVISNIVLWFVSFQKDFRQLLYDMDLHPKAFIDDYMKAVRDFEKVEKSFLELIGKRSNQNQGPKTFKIDDTREKEALEKMTSEIMKKAEVVKQVNEAIATSYKNVAQVISKHETSQIKDLWLDQAEGMKEAAKRAEDILEETGGLTLFDIEQGKDEANQIKDLWQYQIEDLKSAKERADQIMLTETFGKDLYQAEAYRKRYEDMIRLSQETASAMQSSFSDLFFDAMRGEFKSLSEYATSFLRALQRALADFFAQKMVQSMFDGEGGGFLGGFFKKIFSVHSGGVIGQSTLPKRDVNPLVFAGAPRLHGGLMSDEFPAILQKGETVIPKNSTVAPPKVTLNITNKGNQAVSASNISEKWNGQEYIIDVIIDAHERNVNGFRDIMGRSS